VLSSSDPHSISISADGRKLTYSKFTVAQNIWSIPIPRSGSVSISEAVAVTTGNRVIETHDLSPDGEWIAFDSDVRGEVDIYRMRLDGGRPQLVADITGHAWAPDWSPDGSEIAFDGVGSEGTDIFVVPADGGTPEQLTDFLGNDGWPDWSPDGLAIAYQSRGPQGRDPQNTWIVSRDSVGTRWSDPVQVTDTECNGPKWAPDGASLVCYMPDESWARVSRVGEVLSRYDPSTAGLQWSGYNLEFSPDGSRIYFVATHADGSRGVWWVPANGGDATKVVAFDDPSLHLPINLGLLTVGPEIFYLTIAEYESDIWVMDLDW
jgi:Tol biopolymer transport system component